MFALIELIFLFFFFILLLSLNMLLQKVLQVDKFKTINLLLKKKKIQGEIIKDLGLGSFLNAAYSNQEENIKYLLICLSVLAIIVGIILREEENV